MRLPVFPEALRELLPSVANDRELEIYDLAAPAVVGNELLG
jgi:hypothetical protein